MSTQYLHIILHIDKESPRDTQRTRRVLRLEPVRILPAEIETCVVTTFKKSGGFLRY